MFNRLSIAVGMVGGVIIGLAVFSIVNTVWLLPKARSEARMVERAAMDAATNKAIGELTNAADQARVARRLCIERGGLYSHATGKCIQRETE